MFKILKHMVGSDGFISTETVDLAESGNSLLGAFNFYSGGIKRIPLQVFFDTESDSEGTPPSVSDFLLSIYAYFGDDNFSQKYTLERFDEVTNQVFFRNTMTDKTLKVRVLLDPEKFNYRFENNTGDSVDLNYEGFKPLIPDESGCFYLADEHDFSQNSFFFILEFNCEPKFVSSFESAAEFQIGLDFKALEIVSNAPTLPVIPSCSYGRTFIPNANYSEGDFIECGDHDCPYNNVSCLYYPSLS